MHYFYLPPTHHRLGDTWKLACFALSHSAFTGFPVGLISPRRAQTLREVLPLFDSSGSVGDIVETTVPAAPASQPDAAAFLAAHVPTRLAWAPDQTSARICFQFDGDTERAAKAVTPADFERFRRQAAALGLQTAQLGQGMTLAACIEAAATARLFVGVCSGMAQLCYSVGVPVFILRNGYCCPEWHARGLLLPNMRAFLRNLPSFLETFQRRSRVSEDAGTPSDHIDKRRYA